MEKFKQSVKIINYCVPKKYFELVRQYIHDFILYYAGCFMKSNFNILVHIRPNKKTCPELTAKVMTTEEKFVLTIYESLVVALLEGRQRYFGASVLHELVHMRDFKQALNCPFTTYLINRCEAGSEEEFLVKIGFDFWTEINAYWISYINNYKYDIDNPSFFKLTKMFKKIYAFAEKIYNMKKQPTSSQYEGLISSVERFVYDFTKYIAMLLITGKQKKYSQRVIETAEYAYLTKFLKKSKKIIKKIDKNPFSKKFNKKFKMLGRLIFDYFYRIFCMDIILVKNHAQIICEL